MEIGTLECLYHEIWHLLHNLVISMKYIDLNICEHINSKFASIFTFQELLHGKRNP
jgi:hypothetical protein